MRSDRAVPVPRADPQSADPRRPANPPRPVTAAGPMPGVRGARSRRRMCSERRTHRGNGVRPAATRRQAKGDCDDAWCSDQRRSTGIPGRALQFQGQERWCPECGASTLRRAPGDCRKERAIGIGLTRRCRRRRLANRVTGLLTGQRRRRRFDPPAGSQLKPRKEKPDGDAVRLNLHENCLCPRQDSNLRPRLRRAVLYPLSYGGSATEEELANSPADAESVSPGGQAAGRGRSWAAGAARCAGAAGGATRSRPRSRPRSGARCAARRR